jgi:hypothetical protein
MGWLNDTMVDTMVDWNKKNTDIGQVTAEVQQKHTNLTS